MSYRLAARRTTFFGLRRLVLCFIWIVSPVVPLIDFDSSLVRFENEGVSPLETEEKATTLDALLSDIKMPTAEMLDQNLSKITTSDVDYLGYAGVAIITVGVIMIGRIMMQLLSIVRIYRKSKSTKFSDGTSIFLLSGSDASFSFFKWIFVYADSVHSGLAPDIVRHEKIHARQWHSFDVCLGQLMTAACWFNPFAHLLMIETRRNLEFLADRDAITGGSDRKTYQYNLLKSTYRVHPIQIYNSFNDSHLKERILMMNKPTSQKGLRWGYLLLPFITMIFPLMGVFAKGEGSGDIAKQEIKPTKHLLTKETKSTINTKELVVEKKKSTATVARTFSLGKEKTTTKKFNTKSIVGSWVIMSGDSIITYKLLKKNGQYFNLRSYDKGETYFLMRKGLYKVNDDGTYVEKLINDEGHAVPIPREFAFHYTLKGNQLHLKFSMWGKEMYEVWKRAGVPAIINEGSLKQ